ncbi:MAG: extracellular solute-binding protein [Verrucomicrobia bacterium]|nr:extracellular solute-binding protein [Verrucomicrobiota bacterium]
MKIVFVGCLILLTAASVLTHLLEPDLRSDAPVLYWVTDANPARSEQVATFHRWLRSNGHPRMQLRLDTANNAVTKKIIQGVSGVGGDVMDSFSGGALRQLHAVGLLADVTASARALGFDPGHTYAPVASEITIADCQYAFPCNVYTALFWVNKATFAKHGLPGPPRRWDFETFERVGKQFVAAANPSGKRPTVFFAAGLDRDIMRRSLGLSVFNETLTRCTLDDPRNVRALALIHKWTCADRILPTASDVASFATETGYGGSNLQLFNSGNYAMFLSGRYALIQLRQFGALDLAVVEHPYGEFPNTRVDTRCAAIYAGSKHRELARYFLAYLASEEYNLHIVEDADALPPNPIYTRTEAFLRPAKYPNEWGCHEVFADAVQTIGIGRSHSPFVLPSTAERIERETFDGFISGLYPAEQAARLAADRINEEIQRALKENPRLRPRYDQLVVRQRQIEQLRAEGRRVPLAWIANPFHRRYYEFKNWGEK